MILNCLFECIYIHMYSCMYVCLDKHVYANTYDKHMNIQIRIHIRRYKKNKHSIDKLVILDGKHIHYV